MLIACRACGRQYDVSGLQPGTHVRCECSSLLTVESHRPASFQPRRCGQCGAAVSHDARRCSYCDGEITLEEHGLASLCPVCFARLSRDAKYCMACGVAIRPQAIAAVGLDVACPRCKGALRSRALEDISLVECAHCGGLWVGEATLESICENTDRGAVVQQELGTAPLAAPIGFHPAAYIPCITCGEMMLRQNFGQRSGVIIDRCKDHGVWLDHRELSAIIEFVRGGGLARARALDVERWRAERARRTEALAGGSVPCAPIDDAWGGRGGTELGLPEILGWVARQVTRALTR